jgi:hypothetical protein
MIDSFRVHWRVKLEINSLLKHMCEKLEVWIDKKWKTKLVANHAFVDDWYPCLLHQSNHCGLIYLSTYLSFSILPFLKSLLIHSSMLAKLKNMIVICFDPLTHLHLLGSLWQHHLILFYSILPTQDSSNHLNLGES